jgi:predicted outer membrane protein
MKCRGLLAFACAAALTAGCNGNNRTDNTIVHDNTVGTAGSGVSTSDKNFVHEVLSDGTAEVEMSTLAKERAADPEVKRFAQMMIDDHTNAGKLLTQVATTYGIPAQPQLDDKHKGLMDKLSKLRGADFDKEYMNAMVDDHESAVKDVRSRVDEDRSLTDRLTGKNPEDRASVKPEPSDDKVKIAINEWAANVLPTVEHHLDRAKEIKDHIDHPHATARANSGRQGTERY